MIKNQKKILFIDRDGTIIKEHYPSYQIDSIEKLFFYPKVIFFLSKIIKELNYELIMISNQDGLGTNSFPENKFWPIHNHILNVLKSEEILFHKIYIDKTFFNEKSINRKPYIGMLKEYINNNLYDLSKSFVIGDRYTDVLLAKNIGCQAIWIKYDNQHYKNFTEEEKFFYNKNKLNKNNINKIISLKTYQWKDIYNYLSDINPTKLIHQRSTLETNIKISMNIYGNGRYNINTGIGFLDHLIQQLSIHGLIDIDIQVEGDLHVDEHHTIEDIGITLGEIFLKSLDNKIGIERYGFYILPMDDCLSTIALDLGGREWFLWKTKFYREKIGNIPTEMFYHFFKSFCSSAKCNLHIYSIGENEHHKIESIFKCFARAIRMAISKNNYKKVFSTKGIL